MKRNVLRQGKKGVAIAAALAAVLAVPVLDAMPAAAATVIAPPAPASFTFQGSGWGHGVGMSQYGAYGMALSGYSAAQILQHYYAPATVVADTTNPQNLRVQVLAGVSQVTVGGPAGAWSIETAPGVWQPIGDPSITVAWEQTADGVARVHAVVGGVDYQTDPGTMPELWLNWSQGGVTVPGADAGVGSVSYHHGQLALGPLAGTVNVVNQLPLNQYLYGIAEMPSSWPAAALQAQAVAARTYALRAYQAGIRSSINANLTDETTDQKYTAWNKESETVNGIVYGAKWTAAVDAIASNTGGLSVQYNGALAQTYYSSSSGGTTTSSAQAWGSSAIAYLQSQDDHWSALPAVGNPYASWTATLPQATVAKAFGLPDVVQLTVTAKASSGAVMQVQATSSTGVKANLTSGSSADNVRIALGLKSAYFTVAPTPVVVTLPFAVQRLAGADRYGTAVQISTAAFPTSSEIVIVSAKQTSIVDGLVAAPFARSRHAPVLLADLGGLPAATVAEIQRRQAAGPITTAWLVGGEGVLSPAVVTQLQGLGIANVQRLAGPDRYGTAAAVDAAMGNGTAPNVVIASGADANLIDAAAGGGPAAAMGWPVVLVAPNAIPAATSAALTALGAPSAVV
ncbi:MAG: SpoIID/LytB domain-containing protein, partial [Micrococcales bacterium]|nr:SpoIID/LytB domain-containing protein [Micrococcales bacterium]